MACQGDPRASPAASGSLLTRSFRLLLIAGARLIVSGFLRGCCFLQLDLRLVGKSVAAGGDDLFAGIQSADNLSIVTVPDSHLYDLLVRLFVRPRHHHV